LCAIRQQTDKTLIRNLLFLIFTIAVLTACSSEKSIETEKDIFISALDTGFETIGKATLKSSFQTIHFDKDFWNVFIRTHPKTSGILFIALQLVQACYSISSQKRLGLV